QHNAREHEVTFQHHRSPETYRLGEWRSEKLPRRRRRQLHTGLGRLARYKTRMLTEVRMRRTEGVGYGRAHGKSVSNNLGYSKRSRISFGTTSDSGFSQRSGRPARYQIGPTTEPY